MIRNITGNWGKKVIHWNTKSINFLRSILSPHNMFVNKSTSFLNFISNARLMFKLLINWNLKTFYKLFQILWTSPFIKCNLCSFPHDNLFPVNEVNGNFSISCYLKTYSNTYIGIIILLFPEKCLLISRKLLISNFLIHRSSD